MTNNSYNLAKDLDIHLMLKSRNPVQLCLVIVCPTKREQDFWTLAPDECPDPELDLPFACHDGGMSDAKKDKKN